MRYLAAVALGLVLVFPALVPAESGQMVNQYGNVVVSQGGQSGDMCYVDGEARRCDPPAPVTFSPPSDVVLPAGGPGIPPARQHEAGGREGE